MMGLIPEAGTTLGVVASIEISVITAALLAVIFFRLKQPALLAYIVAGLLLGFVAKPAIGSSVEVMEQISHLGLVLLLFIIGLEMDLKGIFKLGSRAAAAVLLQGPLTIAAVWALFYVLHQQGVQLVYFGDTPRAWFFFAAAAGLSSTAVTVKLLADKFELKTQAGKVTVLTLIAQDIWAVLALSYVSSFQGDTTDANSPLLVFVGAVVAAVVMVMVSRYVLSRVAVFIARSPELIALVALGWCFVGAAVFSNVGLSAEMGALVAGLTLGILPTATEVLAKVASLRDFFMALFFVALGISLPPPTWSVMGAAALLVGLVVLTRVLLFSPMLMAARLGPQVAFTSSINLAQISEFALLLVPIGVASRALTETEGSVISYGMMLSVLVTSYGIKYNDAFARGFSRLMPASIKRSIIGNSHFELGELEAASILILGYHFNTRTLIRQLLATKPELKDKILVVDVNLKNHELIRALGVQVAYGDISNPETLRHHGIDKAEVVLSTVADTYLRGTSNLRLLALVTSLNPHARFIGTTATVEEKSELLREGAFGAVCPAETAAPEYDELVSRGLG
jgi:Kef-type K+ transport system membrane component KefB